MPIELKIPQIGESITEVEIGEWLKTEGQPLAKDEPVVILESEKATVDLPAPQSGTLYKILKPKGTVAKIGEVIGILHENGAEVSRGDKQSSTKSSVKTPEAPGASQD